MKEFDLVKLRDDYLQRDTNNLAMAEMGIVLKAGGEKLQVLFFNAYNKGDYAVVDLDSDDVFLVQEKAPEGFQSLVRSFYNKIDFSKSSLNGIKFEEFCVVELVEENPRYEKYGLKKGDRGVVALDFATKDEVLVDFSGVKGLKNSKDGLVSVVLRDLQKVE